MSCRLTWIHLATDRPHSADQHLQMECSMYMHSALRIPLRWNLLRAEILECAVQWVAKVVPWPALRAERTRYHYNLIYRPGTVDNLPARVFIVVDIIFDRKSRVSHPPNRASDLPLFPEFFPYPTPYQWSSKPKRAASHLAQRVIVDRLNINVDYLDQCVVTRHILDEPGVRDRADRGCPRPAWSDVFSWLKILRMWGPKKLVCKMFLPETSEILLVQELLNMLRQSHYCDEFVVFHCKVCPGVGLHYRIP